MREWMNGVPSVRVPYFARYKVSGLKSGDRELTYAVKSALPDAAREPSREIFVLQTAPLCPRKVPIQSPVHSLSIGFPSLQLETSKYVPSSWIGEKERCVTGRVWPGATRGVDLMGWDIKSFKSRRWRGKLVVSRDRGAPRTSREEEGERYSVMKEPEKGAYLCQQANALKGGIHSHDPRVPVLPPSPPRTDLSYWPRQSYRSHGEISDPTSEHLLDLRASPYSIFHRHALRWWLSGRYPAGVEISGEICLV